MNCWWLRSATSAESMNDNYTHRIRRSLHGILAYMVIAPLAQRQNHLKFIVTVNAVNNANAHPRDYVWLFGLQCKLCTMWRVCVCVEYILLSLLINVLRNAYTNGIKFSHPCDATIMFILWMYEWYGWLCGCLLTLSHTYIHPHQHNELCKIVHTKCPNVMSSFSPQFEWITDLHLYNAIVVVFDWKRWELLNRIDVRCAFGTKNYANNNSMWCVHICSTQHSTEHSRKM